MTERLLRVKELRHILPFFTSSHADAVGLVFIFALQVHLSASKDVETTEIRYNCTTPSSRSYLATLKDLFMHVHIRIQSSSYSVVWATEF